MVMKELQMEDLVVLAQPEITLVAVAAVIPEAVVAVYKLAVAVIRRLEAVVGPMRQPASLLRVSQTQEMDILQLL
jgi:hypothetical protein